jgi:hypothetical protein
MEITFSARDRLSTARRVGRIFVERLHGRSTLVIVLLVGLIVAVALAAVRNGVTLGGGPIKLRSHPTSPGMCGVSRYRITRL